LATTVTTYSKFRQHLKKYLDGVFDSHDPLYVKRRNEEDVVVLSKSDYQSLQETLHLLGSPKNAERLLKGIKDRESGKFTERGLIEE